ncbi:MAG: MarR family transcriptional regulator [Candidatus Glassbacteria bacterium]|nr:MarR family transcriptional regulator [Candidatus Glassbacteria bacterium]
MKIEQEIKQKSFGSEHEKLIANLLFTGNWLNSSNDRRLKKFGVSSQQYNVLRILRGRYPGPASVNDLRERMLDRESNASRLVEKLRQKDLVCRSECQRDRRAVDILITDKGLELLNELDRSAGERIEKFHPVSSHQAARLNELLDKLRG